MRDIPDNRRTMAEALADLYAKVDNESRISVYARPDLERMIEALEAEIHDRAERALAWYA